MQANSETKNGTNGIELKQALRAQKLLQTASYKAYAKPIISKYMPQIIITFLISISYGVVQILAASFSKPLIDHISSGQTGFNYLFVLTPLFFILATVANMLLNFTANQTFIKATNKTSLELVKRIAKKPTITEKETTASLINIVSSDSSIVIIGIIIFIPWALSGALTILATLAIIFYYSWIVGVVTVIAFPLFLTLSMVFDAKSGQAQESASKSIAAIKDVTLSGIDGAYYIRRMNAKSYLLKKLVEQQKIHKKHFQKMRLYSNLNMQAIGFLISLFPLTMFAITLVTAASGYGSISNSMLLYSLASTIILPLQLMQNAVGLKVASYKIYPRISIINDYICPKKDGKNMDDLIKIESIENIDVNISSFKYSQLLTDIKHTPIKTKDDSEPSAQKPLKDLDEKVLLENLSFNLKRGELEAIMGESGSGKSTLLKFLSCEQSLPKECGAIKINGIDLLNIEENSYYRAMQYVPQNNYLFKDTLRGNLCLGQSFSDDELKSACSFAILDSFIEEYSLEHEIDVGSKNISGGQLQRICLARAFLRKPSLLILDEPTSALDVQTSEKLIKNLKVYAKTNNCSVLIVTHSQEVANAADKVIKI